MLQRTILLVSVCALVLLLPVAVSADGTITVSSIPTGAAIWLNNTNTGLVTGASPVSLSVANGTHTIVLKLAGYHDSASQSVTIAGDTKPVSATLISAPMITGVSPSTGANTGFLAITITGTGFLSPTVTLTNGSTSFAGANTVVTGGTSITSTFNLNNAAPGTWNLVVLNTDSGTATLQNAFTVTSAEAGTVSSIVPSSGIVNTTVAVTIAGTGFDINNAKMRLTRTGYTFLPGVVTGITPTQMTGTFNLGSQAPGEYTVCVLYDGTNSACGPTFTISTAASVNGSISFSSNPTNAGIYLDNVFKGKTPLLLDNIIPAIHTVTYKIYGYDDSSRQYTITAGQTTDAYASLRAAAVETVSTPVYTVPTTVRKTVTTTKKSTAKIPTPWPTATPTKSPVDLLVIIGAAGLGYLIVRR